MRLGATISKYSHFEDPEAYVTECHRWGYRAAPSPKVNIHETEKLRAIKRAFGNAGIVIAEVGAWVNALDPNHGERSKNLEIIAEALSVADELEAVCCVTVAGSFNSDHMVGPHPDNFKDSTFDAVVEWVRHVLQWVRPRHTKLTLEMAPWTVLDGPEIYRRLIEAIDHPQMAVHLDPANAVCDTHLYFTTTEMLNYSFDLLGQWIVSCHAKDILQSPDPKTISLAEVIPGRGVLDYRTFLTRIDQVSRDTPLIIEHLLTEQEYSEAASFIRTVAREAGLAS